MLASHLSPQIPYHSFHEISIYMIILPDNPQTSSFFCQRNIRRKKRQIDGPDFDVCQFLDLDNCSNHSFEGLAFDQCDNDKTCLFDLAVTGDEEFANTTLRASEENSRVQAIISKNSLSEMQLAS